MKLNNLLTHIYPSTWTVRIFRAVFFIYNLYNKNFKIAHNIKKGRDKMNSYWLSSIKKNEIEKQIDNNYVADVCIIGAGITGLSTAYYLAKNGLKVIIVDKSRIGEKTSGHTTAKITLQHGLIYNYLINTFGFDYALNYFRANEKAILNIKNIIDTENIDCDFELKNNYIYTTNQNDLTKIHSEINAVNSLR